MTWVNGHKLQNGKYTIEKKVGDGGFGITYLATTANGHRVVIKTLNDTVQSRPDFNQLQQDFLNEALRLAKCTNPHIVKINEVVQEGQLWCMVMEYIDGEDLANRVIKQGVLPEAEALRYIQQIGEALTVVHQQGLLHRDVKPQNIMLRSGKLEAVLIDFGIAREFTQDVTQTHTEYRTEFFAPIEQYDRREKRGAYTDVYALAATLYVILTAKFPQPSPLRAAGTPLTPPKQHNSSISDNVNRAILKGMALKAKDRPQSVAKWLKLLPSPSISTPKKPSSQGKLKNKLLIGGLLVGSAVLGLISREVQIYCQKQFNSNPISLLISSFSLKTTLTGHSNSVNSVAFSPDGQTLASGSFDDTIKIWDIRSGKLKTTLTGHSNWVRSVAFSPDGQTLASGSRDNTIKIWDIRSGQLKTTLTGHSDNVNSVAFSPDGQTLASGSDDKTIKIWDIHSGQLKTTLTGHSNDVNSVAFSPDGQTLASSGSYDNTIKLWRISP
ncbi:serine/threonine-protein kinase [Aerosakkonema funiforme]|uniref:Serine/threonine protein kinase n=1 Tax=Aerosakkonema funiforme FACHB-1375 TaxID=2949571 RepID=A0A926ZK16_9CYAN|nr:serine/threonine-protein kinase [Aerosakkonema funiforme]MBD2184912.1 serine/threonine protein kinase [Aerosakkonema funiforme FACHB-1375]